MQLVLQAPAKVNLYLRILGKRADGYHQLETLLQTVELADQLVLTRRPAGISLQCDDPRLGTGADNLAYRAAALLARQLPGAVGVHIQLKKRVPWQAGLGGGSSDAGAVLLGLNRLWQLHWPLERLAQLAAQLGSDVPFFLWGGLALATGRGEVVRPLPVRLSGSVFLVIPPFGLSTPAVYQALAPSTSAGTGLPSSLDSRVAALSDGTSNLAALLQNDLEPAAFALRPELQQLKHSLLAHGYPALLSGSGSCLFALPATRPTPPLTDLLPAGYRLIVTRFSPGSGGPRQERPGCATN